MVVTVVLVVLLLALSTVGVLGWALRSVRRNNQLLHKLPRTPIRDVVAGTKVRVVGTARSLGHDVSGHFTGTACLACHSWISGGAGDGDPLKPSGDRVVAFTIEDDTGTIEVGVEHVKLSLDGHMVDMATSHTFGASIIAREVGSLGGSATYCEERLPADSRVAAIGYVVRRDDGALRLVGRAGERLVIANQFHAFLE